MRARRVTRRAVHISGYSPHRFPAVHLDGLRRDAASPAARTRLIGRQLFTPFCGRHFNLLASPKAVPTLEIVRHFGSPNRPGMGRAGSQAVRPGTATHLPIYATMWMKLPGWLVGGARYCSFHFGHHGHGGFGRNQTRLLFGPVVPNAGLLNGSL